MDSPELADPLGVLEVGQHEDVKQLGAGTRPECIQEAAKRRETTGPQRERQEEHDRGLTCGTGSDQRSG